ncbi:MAG TPA: response regulator [Steroidobacteraceae bacterium]|jgi:DNA-binding response OmpR family regulator
MSAIPKMDTPLHVLIAEDSATQAQRLTHILESHGYRVTAAPNGRRALEAAMATAPQLVISDVVMPEMDGYELCRRIKSTPALKDTPVILVTTLSDPQDVIRGLECGADNFILKPYDEAQLLHRIEFVLINRRTHQGEQLRQSLTIVFDGHEHFITADRLQILNLLLSTYEAAIQRNKELSSTRDMLREANSDLKQLTRELEDRVQARTRDLERSNEALRQAQQALIQQERLRALGQMASGIAHDINNAISPIALYTEALLEREPDLSARARENLTTIRRAIDDVAQTVGRMREFYRAREQEPNTADLELNALVQQVAELTRARWNDMPQRRGIAIELKTSLQSDLPLVRGAANEIRDALTNLIFNAVDAIPEGGSIEISTSVVDRAAGEPARLVRLQVRDSGVGMDEDTRRRCIEPFFTTKGERGTGLGLAMVYGMTQRHQAILDIESASGAGTAIRIDFPAGTQADKRAPVSAEPRAQSRNLRVLLVDDDRLLLQSMSSTLRDEGHEITAAEGGQAGLDAFHDAQRRRQPFDIVITDLGMPHVDGAQVIKSIRAASPQTPIVLLTGWGQNVQGSNHQPPKADRLLAKPPRLRELRAALAELTAPPEQARTG